MPRFYIHVKNNKSYTPDTEGEERADADAAYASALRTAAELVGEEMLRGETAITLTFSIDDAAGARVRDLAVSASVGDDGRAKAA